MSLIKLLKESSWKASIDQYDAIMTQPKEGSSFSIRCDGDIVVGDVVKFKKDKWGGSFKRPTHLGTEDFEGRIMRDSYGGEDGQHTFTIRPDGTNSDKDFRIKGRNLYKYPAYRKPWVDEEYRNAVLKDKHQRGSEAREMKKRKREEGF